MPKCRPSDTSFVKLLGLDLDVLFARCFLLEVLLHPRGPALPGGGIAAGELESGNVGIGDGNLCAVVFRHNSNEGIGQRRTGSAIENVPFHAAAVLASDGDVAAIVKGFFESAAQFFFFDGRCQALTSSSSFTVSCTRSME